jgi:hypothetical protein
MHSTSYTVRKTRCLPIASLRYVSGLDFTKSLSIICADRSVYDSFELEVRISPLFCVFLHSENGTFHVQFDFVDQLVADFNRLKKW